MTTEQTPPNEPLSVADFSASGYEAILGSDTEEEYMLASNRLRHAADAAGEAGQLRVRAILTLLADATSMTLVSEDKLNPFRPRAQFADRRSAIPADFSDDAIALFAAVAPTIADRHLRARLADLVWLRARKHGITFALLAIDAYRETPPDEATWFSFGHEYWNRAVKLTLSIGAVAGARRDEIEASLLSAVFATAEDGYVPLQAAGILLANNLAVTGRVDIATRMEALATASAASGEYRHAIAYFEAAAKWYSRSGVGAKTVEMIVRTADCWEAQGAANGAGLASLHFFENAIKVLRTVPGASRAQYTVEQRIEALHGKVRAAGLATAGQMQSVQSEPVDVSELVERAKAEVRGKQPLEALIAFSRLYRGARVATIRATAENSLNNSIFRRIVSSAVISSQGHTIARQPAAGDGPAEEEAAVWAQMVRDYQHLVGLVTMAEIRPALGVLQLEHALTIWDFEELCSSSAFVPPDRVELMAEALYAGYCGEMVHAIHVLVPQVENIVRVHLQAAGAVTTTTSTDGIVMENGMSTLVKLPQMLDVFGENLTFELTALFCDQNGPNLRNEVAHGLASKDTCESAAGMYAWWLAFSLMFKSFWGMHQRAAQAAAEAQVATETHGDTPPATPDDETE